MQTQMLILKLVSAKLLNTFNLDMINLQLINEASGNYIMRMVKLGIIIMYSAQKE